MVLRNESQTRLNLDCSVRPRRITEHEHIDDSKRRYSGRFNPENYYRMLKKYLEKDDCIVAPAVNFFHGPIKRDD